MNTINMDLFNIVEDTRIDMMFIEHDMFMKKILISNDDNFILSESILNEFDTSAIKNILEKIKSFFKKIKDIVVEFFTKLFDFIRNLIISGLEKLYDAILERKRKKVSESFEPINELFEQFNSNKVQKLRKLYQEALPKFRQKHIVLEDIPWYDDLNNELDKCAKDIIHGVTDVQSKMYKFAENDQDIKLDKEFFCKEISKSTQPKIYDRWIFSGATYNGSFITMKVKNKATLVEHGVIIEGGNIDKYTKQIERAVFEQSDWKNSIKSLFEDTKRYLEASEKVALNKMKDNNENNSKKFQIISKTTSSLISIVTESSKDIQNSQGFLFNQGLKIVKRIISYSDIGLI